MALHNPFPEQRTAYRYQPCYCEENIWHLCQHEMCTDSQVIFIASLGDAFPMLKQRAMADALQPVLWDYHVVLLLPAAKYQILDFDTTLPFSSDIDTYFKHSFLDPQRLSAEYIPLFRVVPAAEYALSFASDRRHMKTASGWSAPPPDWPVIGSGGSNLSKFTEMNDHDIGEIFTADDLLETIRLK